MGVLVMPTWAFTGKVVSGAGIDCSQRYAYLYQNFGGGGGSRLFCVADSDIEGEPGNVMGPLGDDPSAFLNDFDTNTSSSGVSSVKVHDAAGGSTWGLCLYANKNFGGQSFVFWGNVGPADLVAPYTINDLAGSLKFITAPGAC